MKDEMIIELYWKRDENAIKATESKYSAYLSKIAYNILSDTEDTLECLNDTYLAAWNSIPPHRPLVLSSYLGKLTRRISIDIFRKKNREKRRASEYSLSLFELSDCVSTEPSLEDNLEAELLAKKISEFLKEQKPDIRRAFIGRYFFFDSVKEISKYCNFSEAKTKTVLFRTRIALKKYLEKEGYTV